MKKSDLHLNLFIAYEYLINRKRQVSVSIIGVMVGVGFFIAIFSLLKGMQLFFVNRVINVSPHVIIKDEFRSPPIQPIFKLFPKALIEIKGIKPKEESRGIRNKEKILNDLKSFKDIIAAPVLEGQAFLRYGGKDVTTTLIGINPADEKKVSNLDQDIYEGNINNLISNSNGIILGKGLAKKLGVKLGSKLSVVAASGNTMKMKVVGLFSTSITILDMFNSYVLLKKAQIIQNKNNTINKIKLRLKDINNSDKLASKLERRYKYRAESWRETNQNIFDLFVIQNSVMYSTVIAILIVAGFGIYNIISTIINEKQKDIAILKSIGFSENNIRQMFLFQGLIVGIIGSILGWCLGAILIEILSAVQFKLEGQETFLQLNGFILYKSFEQYLISGFLAILTASYSAYLPARKASSLNPVDIIRGAT